MNSTLRIPARAMAAFERVCKHLGERIENGGPMPPSEAFALMVSITDRQAGGRGVAPPGAAVYESTPGMRLEKRLRRIEKHIGLETEAE